MYCLQTLKCELNNWSSKTRFSLPAEEREQLRLDVEEAMASQEESTEDEETSGSFYISLPVWFLVLLGLQLCWFSVLTRPEL